MKPEIRQQQLMNRLRAVEREWRVDELARALKVSPLTIRRDLDALERVDNRDAAQRDGIILQKTAGGAGRPGSWNRGAAFPG